MVKNMAVGDLDFYYTLFIYAHDWYLKAIAIETKYHAQQT